MNNQPTKRIITRYYNGRILREHVLRQEDLWVVNGEVISPQQEADENIDVDGKIIAPGFIDLQLNGAFGIDLSTEPEKVMDVAKQLPKYGVTAFLPTVISSKKEVYQKILPHLQPKKLQKHAEILGIHLEGPFLNPNKSRAHDRTLMQSFEKHPSPLEFYGSLDGVKLVTLAPELEGALEAIHALKKRKVMVAAGHTEASYQDMQLAFDSGLTIVTHLFNAMSQMHHRSPGVIGSTLTNPKIFYSIIADGHHVHPSVLNLAWKSNPEGFFLVTDAISALGLSDGNYRLGEQKVVVNDGAAFIPETETLAGSVLSMDAAVRMFHASAGCAIGRALEAASWKPAKALGIENKKGHLNPGADADFVILNDALDVLSCYIAGEQAFPN